MKRLIYTFAIILGFTAIQAQDNIDLISNGDFEGAQSGDIQYLGTVANNTQTDWYYNISQDGQHEIVTDMNSGATGSNCYKGIINKTMRLYEGAGFKVQEGETYTCSFDYYVPTGSVVSLLTLKLVYDPSVGTTEVGTPIRITAAAENDNWVHLQAEWVATSDAASHAKIFPTFKIKGTGDGTAASDVIYIDNVMINGPESTDITPPTDTPSTEVVDISIQLDFSESHPLNKGVYGLNNNLLTRPFFLNNSGFVEIYNDLGKPTIRYPGGTGSNYVNIYTGIAESWDGANDKDLSRVSSLNSGMIKNGKPDGEDYTKFTDFLVNQDASVTYVVNITCMTLEQNRLVLQDIKDKGGDISFFEIGNELYYNQYKSAIPDIDDYLVKAKAVTSMIRTIYPDASIGVLVPSHVWSHENFLDGGVNDNKREEVWYDKISKEDFYDAVVIHMYASNGMDASTLAADFLPYTSSYKYGLSHIDAKLTSVSDRLAADFPNKDVFVTEYHTGGFGGDARSYRLRYSYLGGFLTANYMMKMFAHDNITMSSWHSMVQIIEYGSNGDDLLADDYDFGTFVNYHFFKQFKEPVANSSSFSNVNITNGKTYAGIGDLGLGDHAELDAGNFFNPETQTGYLVVFNKLDSKYQFSKSVFENENNVLITECEEMGPDKSKSLNVALQNEQAFSISAISPTSEGNFIMEPYSMYTIKYSFGEVAVESIQMTETTLDIGLNSSATEKLKVQFYPANANPRVLEWSSSNTDIVDVNDRGELTAIAIGEATIYAKYVEDLSIYTTCDVVVDLSNTSTSKLPERELKIYPNPAKEYVRIDGIQERSNFIIYDINGRVMKSGEVSNNNNISLIDLNQGTYVLSIFDRKYCNNILLSKK